MSGMHYAAAVRCGFFRMAVALLVAALLLPCGVAAAQEGARYQVQIGSAKDLEGTKWYASKASRVLGESTYVIKGGSYYIVLTGYYESKERAQDRLMEVRQHYNGMVVSYELEDVIAGYEDGIPLNENELLDLLTSGERKRARREKLRETQPIRKVQHDEADGLRKTVEEGLRNVRVEGCTLRSSEELAGYLFRTSVPLAELDPYSLKTTHKHGEKVYIELEAKGGLSKVTTEQLTGGKVRFTRKDPTISLKPVQEAEASVEQLATALQELITFCAK